MKSFSFQSLLAHSLFDLDQRYRELHQEKRRVISRRHAISGRWFHNRLKLIHDYQEAIDALIATGKVLGDAFAWLFYHEQREYLLEHAKHQRLFHSPPGVGGQGELTFIDACRVVDGHFVLYHGITNILRHGDVSFIDTRDLTLAGIGELKTQRVGPKELEIGLHVVWQNKQQPPTLFKDLTAEAEQHPTDHRAGDLPQATRHRLQRQLKGTASSLRSPDTGETTVIDVHIARGPIERVVANVEG